MAPTILVGVATKDLPAGVSAVDAFNWLSNWASNAGKWALKPGATLISAGQESGTGFHAGAVFTIDYSQ